MHHIDCNVSCVHLFRMNKILRVDQRMHPSIYTILKVSTSGLSCNGLNALINLTITRIFRLWPFHWPSVQIPALKPRILMEAAFYVSHDTLDSNFNKINVSLFVPVYNIGASSTSWKQSNISLKRLILLFESGMQ